MKLLPKQIHEGLSQRRIKWYLDLIDEGYTQGQIALFENSNTQTINFRIKNFEGVYIAPPLKGSKIRFIDGTSLEETQDGDTAEAK